MLGLDINASGAAYRVEKVPVEAATEVEALPVVLARTDHGDRRNRGRLAIRARCGEPPPLEPLEPDRTPAPGAARPEPPHRPDREPVPVAVGDEPAPEAGPVATGPRVCRIPLHASGLR